MHLHAPGHALVDGVTSAASLEARPRPRTAARSLTRSARAASAAGQLTRASAAAFGWRGAQRRGREARPR
jgi:hypothetical protein